MVNCSLAHKGVPGESCARSVGSCSLDGHVDCWGQFVGVGELWQKGDSISWARETLKWSEQSIAGFCTGARLLKEMIFCGLPRASPAGAVAVQSPPLFLSLWSPQPRPGETRCQARVSLTRLKQQWHRVVDQHVESSKPCARCVLSQELCTRGDNDRQGVICGFLPVRFLQADKLGAG